MLNLRRRIERWKQLRHYRREREALRRQLWILGVWQRRTLRQSKSTGPATPAPRRRKGRWGALGRKVARLRERLRLLRNQVLLNLALRLLLPALLKRQFALSARRLTAWCSGAPSPPP